MEATIVEVERGPRLGAGFTEGNGMAEVFAPCIDSPSTTPGERVVCRFLADVFAGDAGVRVWHEVAVDREHLDFALFHPAVGLVVLEVKDIALEDVLSTESHSWLVRVHDRRGGRVVEKAITSPYRQARGYLHALRNAMERVEDLCHASGPLQGRPVIPVLEMVVLTRMERARAESGEHGARFRQHARQTLYQDDLDGRSRFGRAGGALSLVQLFASMAVFTPPLPLTTVHGDMLAQRVFSDSLRTLTVSRPQRLARRTLQLALTPRALRWASEMEAEPRLVRGVAGCGKTLFLVQHAVLKARLDPRARRILFTCFNLALTRYLRTLVGENLEPSRHGRVTVRSIFEICGDVLREEVLHEGRTPAYYDDLVTRALAVAPSVPDEFRFDTLLIDEAQDFSPDMLRLVVALGRGGTQDIKIAEDATQDIFGRKPRRFAYRDVGIHIRGARSHRFMASYRCTQPIFDFAHDLADVDPAVEGGGDDDSLFQVDLVGRDGPPPTRRPCGDLEDMVRYLVRDIRIRVLQDRIPPAEVAILYLHRLLVEGKAGQEPFSPQEFCGLVREALQHEGIPVSWFTRDSTAKRALDLGEASVKLGSVYSAKGLDFEVVYLLDLTREPLPPAGARVSPREDHHRRLLFVGATRARERLTLLSLEQASPRRG